MPSVKLQFLGTFRAMDGAGGDLASLGRRGTALLAYLMLGPDRPQPREKLATLLWPDRPDDQARHSLRQALGTLRRALGDADSALVIGQGETVALNRRLIDADVPAFERCATETDPESLERALTLYHGDLLDGFNIPSEEFDLWLAAERTRLKELAATVLERLLMQRLDQPDPQPAIETAKRLLAIEPTRESAHRALMRLYDRSGQRTLALQQYKACVEAIRRELDAEPEPETVRLFETIRDRTEAPVAASDAPLRPSVAVASPARRALTRDQWAWLATAVVVVVGIAGVLVPRTWTQDELQPPAATHGSRMAFPLPDRPSIAVLPLKHSGDATSATLAEGVAEEITSALANVSPIFVISRDTTLSFQGRSRPVKEIAETLGVRYILDGSVQRADERVRINVQLVDTLQGTYLWTARYDRELKDIFALQDDITLEVITALQVKISEGEQERISLVHGTQNLDAWMLAGQGLQHVRRLTRGDNARARLFYQQAVARDPNYPGAWEGLGWTYLIEARFGWSESRDAALAEAAKLADKTLALNPKRARSFALLGTIKLMFGEFAEAVALGEKAVSLGPNDSDAAALLAYTLTFTGEIDRSITLVTKAMRQSPYYPEWYRWTLARALRLGGRPAEAITVLSNGRHDGEESIWPSVEMALALNAVGRDVEARQQAAAVQKLEPKFSARDWLLAPRYMDAVMMQREAVALRTAGFSD